MPSINPQQKWAVAQFLTEHEKKKGRFESKDEMIAALKKKTGIDLGEDGPLTRSALPTVCRMMGRKPTDFYRYSTTPRSAANAHANQLLLKGVIKSVIAQLLDDRATVGNTNPLNPEFIGVCEALDIDTEGL